jgi:hypothetical protein
MDMSNIDTNLDDRKPDILVADPELLKERAKLDYVDQLAFNEELVTIYLYRGAEECAPNVVPFWVNGRGVEVPVEKPVLIKRKYVEIMARTNPFKVKTDVVKSPDGERIQNLWRRESSAQYPFTMVEDKNPRGRAWLEGIKREG